MQSAQSIDRAAMLNKLALIGYIGSLVVVAILTLLSWWAGSHLQDVIQKDADARIAEADSKAAVANENAGTANERAGIANKAASKANESAALANERAQKLERDNIQLRTDLETATAEARERQAELAKEQGKLANEQRKTAEAQREAAVAQLALKEHLDEVAARQADRKLSRGFREIREMRDILVDKPYRGDPWRVRVQYKAQDDEAFRFAQAINRALRLAGWDCIDDEAKPITKDPSLDAMMRSWYVAVRPGITIVIPTGLASSPLKHKMVSVLAEDFTAAGFPPTVAASEDGLVTQVVVIIGSKISN